MQGLSNETTRTSERARMEKEAASDCRRDTHLESRNTVFHSRVSLCGHVMASSAQNDTVQDLVGGVNHCRTWWEGTGELARVSLSEVSPDESATYSMSARQLNQRT